LRRPDPLPRYCASCNTSSPVGPAPAPPANDGYLLARLTCTRDPFRSN
jgi:hypothetical protein